MTTTHSLRDEKGLAMVMALFMMLALSVLGTSLMFVSKTETLSSHNYRLMSQARYGAESGIHVASNYLLSGGYSAVMPNSASDAWSNYDTSKSPVTLVSNGAPVVLSSDSSSSNYPVTAVKTAFAALFAGNAGKLDVNDAPVAFTATATLMAMRKFTDTMTGQPTVLQTWEIVGEGGIVGARNAVVDVSSVLERQSQPLFPYAAFATYSGCAALDLAGGAVTDSYDSAAALVGGVPVTAANTGNVGTNGNLKEVGNTTVVHGSLSTPRAGVGTCDEVQNVTALTQTGGASVDSGINQLSQPVNYPSPPAISPLPPTTATDFKKTTGCPAGFAGVCAPSTNGATFTPASASTVITMGNVTMNAGAVLHLNAGIYVVNSLKQVGVAQLVVDSGPVVIKVAGQSDSNPIDIAGNGIANPSFNPQNLQFIYGGTDLVKLNGGSQTSATFYMPNAQTTISGGGALYGALVTRTLKDTGGADIHYDRRLRNGGLTAGNYMLSAFTWKNY